MTRLGVIGHGGRISNVIQHCLRKADPDISVVAIVDPDESGARSRLDDADKQDVVFYKTVNEMVRKANLDALAIGTRCNLHTPMAIKVSTYDIPLYLEKPVSITMKQANDLERAFEKSKCEVVVSFPLRVSPLSTKSKELIDKGEIGTPQHIMALNYVPYGRCYWESFYRYFDISGGLWLQKATHDLDYITYLMSSPITRIAAMGSFNLFSNGSMSEGLTCASCRKRHSCPESPESRAKMGQGKGSDHLCFFSKELKPPKTNEDASSCVFQFENGAHGTYNQVFYSLRDAGQRGPRISGYEGTLEFDWYKNSLKLIKHFDQFKADYSPQGSGESHFGGDTQLADDFIALVKGKGKSRTPIRHGIQSAYNCLAARESMQKGKFVDVRQVGQVTNPKKKSKTKNKSRINEPF